MAEILINVTFVGSSQQVRQQTRIKTNHTCILINVCNSINGFQQNKSVENWDGVKSLRPNKRPKKRDYKIVIKGLSDVKIPLGNHKHMIKIVFTRQFFLFKYQIK